MRFQLKHLALVLGLSILLTCTAAIIATWLTVDDELADLLEEDIQQQAFLLSELVTQGHIQPQELQHFLQRTFPENDEETFLVIVQHLQEGWQVSNFDLPPALGSTRSGMIQRHHDDHLWRGYQLGKGPLLVQLLRRDDLTADIRSEVTENVLQPILIGLGISLLLLLLLLWLTLHPLGRLVRELHKRNPQDLTPIRLNTPLLEMITLRERLNQLMQGVAQTLARQQAFASDVAHELRTPLTTMKLELAAEEPDLPALRQETSRMARVVEQLLTLARLERQHWTRQFQPIAVESLLEALIQRLLPRFQQAGLQLEWQLQPAQVTGDETLLTLLVENLLLNCLRHCPPKTRVFLQVTPRPANQLRISVQDNGPGIPAEQCQRMMQPFTQMDQRGDGLGLGLAICQRVAQIHQGQLQLVPGNPGLHCHLDLPCLPEAAR